MQNFESELTQRVIFGKNAVERLGEAAKALSGYRVLIVTDPGVQDAGIVAQGIAALQREGIVCHTFADVAPNPTTRHVEAAHAFAKANAPIDIIVGLGGGSAMDCAKGVNFLLTNGGKMEDYWGSNRATRAMLPSIGIPTTAGTGSEAQSFALISQAETHIKMACGDRKAKFATVILDPGLITTVPKPVAAATGIDAIAHAVESFVTTRRNLMSSLFAHQAWRLLTANFEAAVEADSVQLDAECSVYGNMLFGAYLAGTAIEHSMLGAAHACANPLTAQYDITHGVAVALMLPHVIRFNSTVVGDLYRELSPDRELTERIVALKHATGLPHCLRDFGIARSDIPTLAEEAAAQWTAQFNPRPLALQDFVRLYEATY